MIFRNGMIFNHRHMQWVLNAHFNYINLCIVHSYKII